MFLFYNVLFVYFNICLGFVMFLPVAPYVCAVYAPDNNKGVSKDCVGFSDSMELFNLQFYIFALLFLIFDLEILILLPWCITVHLLGWSAYISSMVFFLFITFGFIFEWLLVVVLVFLQGIFMFYSFAIMFYIIYFNFVG